LPSLHAAWLDQQAGGGVPLWCQGRVPAGQDL